MKKAAEIVVRALLLAVLVIFATIKATPQEKKLAIPEVPKYDTSNQITLEGKVQAVKEYQCAISGTLGTHLLRSSEV